MKKPQKENGLRQQAKGKKPHTHSNSAAAQRQRLMDWFHQHYKISTIAARRDLDIMMPAARIHELRHRFGFNIDKVWVSLPTDSGKLHRVAMYVLLPGSGGSHA